MRSGLFQSAGSFVVCHQMKRKAWIGCGAGAASGTEILSTADGQGSVGWNSREVVQPANFSAGSWV